MDVNFEDEELETLITCGKSKNKLYKKLSRNVSFMRDLIKVYNTLLTLPNVDSIKCIGSLNYEKLRYNYSGKSSVRIGFKTKYRLIFIEKEDGLSVKLLETNEHYGDK